MKALILAAGYATRLYPITKDFPKPLLRVGKRAIIDYIFDKLAVLEQINEVIVITNDKFFGRFEKWKHGLKAGKAVTLVNDLTKTHEDKLGAIGDMHFAISSRKINDDLLVIGGDNLFDSSLNGFLSFARKHKTPAIGVYDIKDKTKASHYGVLTLNREGRILEFKEKPAHPESTYVGMCLYYFPKEKLGLLEEYLSGRSDKKDATGYYIDWLSRKVAVYGFIFDCRWFDIGDKDFYNKARQNFAIQAA